MTRAAETLEGSAAVRKRLRRSPFYALLGLLMLALAIAGFWPQYFTVLAGGVPEASTRFWLIHLHAAMFVAWLLAYISQAVLVMQGRTRVHRRLGPWLAGYGFLIALAGIYAAGLLAHRFGVRHDDPEAAAAFVFFPLIDMLFFAGFLAAAILWRRRPDMHKRAMLVATFSIAVVGIGRLVALLPVESPLVWQPLNLAPLLAAVAYDLVVCRKVYAVMAVGLAVHLFRLSAEQFASSEAWLPVGRALVAPFA